ncbi:predicted protein [Scheffersomyces stipitis CBS 6054]|uniref:Opaque-phase-specific protein OP4 n=1 Tax=Scheffersomyces stipitis (strain ATCC 58785 / CBS 6054 / NBRC 10063 / NRRL Y-11545) TaxID=322104 RepID=A3GHU1_PICST|nr:predicted protein [Scheffersomyces stipitis CBS 6054]EAZ62878.1 predicted protein [Scheffersomyces stipitis CBS 6054]
MKLSNTALLAIVASSTLVAAAPAKKREFTTVKRSDINEVLEILKDIQGLKQKREFLEGDELIALDARADNAIVDLISALFNSGIIGEIWNTLTTDTALQSTLKNLIQSAINGLIVQGPALISAIWNSGLIGNLFNTLINDADVRSSFLGVVKYIFDFALNLITGGSSTTAAAAPAPAPSAAPAAKREITELNLNGEYLDKRDVSEVVTYIYNAIKDSGIVTTLINKVLADPQQSISFLTSALQYGVVAVEDVYGWAKSSGLLDEALQYLQENGGTYIGAIASWLSGAISSGSVSASDIAAASVPSNTGATSVATTAAAAAPAAKANPTTTAGAATTAAPVPTAAATNNDAVLQSLINAYGGTPNTVATTVATAGLAGSINQLVGAANQAAGSLKKRRVY